MAEKKPFKYKSSGVAGLAVADSLVPTTELKAVVQNYDKSGNSIVVAWNDKSIPKYMVMDKSKFTTAVESSSSDVADGVINLVGHKATFKVNDIFKDVDMGNGNIAQVKTEDGRTVHVSLLNTRFTTEGIADGMSKIPLKGADGGKAKSKPKASKEKAAKEEKPAKKDKKKKDKKAKAEKSEKKEKAAPAAKTAGGTMAKAKKVVTDLKAKVKDKKPPTATLLKTFETQAAAASERASDAMENGKKADFKNEVTVLDNMVSALEAVIGVLDKGDASAAKEAVKGPKKDLAKLKKDGADLLPAEKPKKESKGKADKKAGKAGKKDKKADKSKASEKKPKKEAKGKGKGDAANAAQW